MHILHIDGHWKNGKQLERLVRGAIAAAHAEADALDVQLYVSTIRLRELLREDFDPEAAKPPTGAANLLAACKKTDGILFSSPVMSGGTTPKMREALGYLYKLEYPRFELKGKPFGFIVNGKEDGGRSTLSEVTNQLEYDMGMTLVPFGAFYRIDDGATGSEGKWMEHDHDLAGQNLVRYIARELQSPYKALGWDRRK